MPDIKFLAFNDCMVSGITGPMEIFSIANTFVEEAADGGFTGLDILSPDGCHVRGFAGIPVQVSGSIHDSNPEILVIPPCFGDVGLLLEDFPLIRRLVELIDSGTVVTTVCAGSFLLAATGYLDGKAATTHWNLVEDFISRFPKVELRAEQMLIDGGSYVCSGGAMAWQDLALHLISRFLSRAAASSCAKMLVMDSTRHVQTPYFMFDQRKAASGFDDKQITKVQMWMQEHYRQSRSVEDLAQLAGFGVRTFLRRFKKATGTTPNSYLQQLRVESARHLLEVSTKGVDEITEMVGYDNPSSFRRLFKKKTGVSPREYRSRFSRIG